VRIKSIELENVRSFLDPQKLHFDGPISIIVGPNGGGKTNLLDAIIVMLRRYLINSMQISEVQEPGQERTWQIAPHPGINNMVLEKHWLGRTRTQRISITVEVSASDIENMRAIKEEFQDFLNSNFRLQHDLIPKTLDWDFNVISEKEEVTYTLIDGQLEPSKGAVAYWFKQYLQLFELYNWTKEREGRFSVRLPILNLPTNRAANFNSNVQLTGYNRWESKVSTDMNFSRTPSSVVALAIGKIASDFRLMLEDDDGTARKRLNEDPNLLKMQDLMKGFGYRWYLGNTNPLANAYDLILEKGESRFSLSAASSGEKEFMTYVLAVFALDIRDALILVDEPELHLHPRWQAALLRLFEDLADKTGNQFLLATHSPSFISAASIGYVSRVFSSEGQSAVAPVQIKSLPEVKHLLSIVNSSNNERIFFADKVLLVEGLSDKIFIDAMIDCMKLNVGTGRVVEVVSVMGKQNFTQYKKLLDAASIPAAILADLDYVVDLGSDEIKNLYRQNDRAISRDVVGNKGSRDGRRLVEAIDQAISTKDWSGAEDIWASIKQRRVELRNDLEDRDRVVLTKFIKSKRKDGIYILSEGSLERYLPPKFSVKDIGNLVNFVKSAGFYDAVKPFKRGEIERILRSVFRSLS
jgi:putative ATP-dependent endonuclease of OLD family